MGLQNIFLRVSIPVPPIGKQNEIADHIQGLRKRAKQLKKAAQQVVEKVRGKIEEMILAD